MADYINREAAISACYDGFADCRDDCAANIRKLPAADVAEVRHGRWTITYSRLGGTRKFARSVPFVGRTSCLMNGAWRI